MKVYKAGEFAAKIGVSPRTLVRWDQTGKFKAYRTPTNQKYYTHEQYVSYCAKSGMSDEEIDMLDAKRKDGD